MSDPQAEPALQPWQQAVLQEARQFVLDAQREFAARVQRSGQNCPLPERRMEVVATYVRNMVGLAVQTHISVAGDSLVSEEQFMKVSHELFAEIRSALLRQRIMGDGLPRGIVP